VVDSGDPEEVAAGHGVKAATDGVIGEVPVPADVVDG
jgi:hypothetical protein